MAAKKKAAKKRASKKRVVKKRVTKKRAVKKRAVRRANPIYKEHVVVAVLRPDMKTEATRKRLNVVNRLYFDGAGWNEKLNNAARFRSRAHAVSIAKLVVESALHNDKYRQVGVTEAETTRGKQRGAA